MNVKSACATFHHVLSFEDIVGQKPAGAAKAAAARTRGRPRVHSDVEKRQVIAGVTSRLFMEHGYQGVSMAGVAAEAHVSLSTIYRLFPSKALLFQAIVERHRYSMVALPGDYEEYPVEAALERIFLVEMASDTERGRAELMRKMISESQKFPELLPVLHETGPEYSRKLLVDWLEDQRSVGRIQFDDAAIVARMLMDIAFGMSSPKFSGEPDWDGSLERTRYLRACFRMVANGLKVNSRAEPTN